jgi:hypothetical protein
MNIFFRSITAFNFELPLAILGNFSMLCLSLEKALTLGAPLLTKLWPNISTYLQLEPILSMAIILKIDDKLELLLLLLLLS